MEPGQLQGHLTPIMQAAEAQARAALSAGSLDADAVIEYAQQHRPDMLRNAMHKHATMRQTSGYAEIRKSYLASLGELNPEAALAADLGPGVSQYLDKGRVVVRLPDGSTALWRQTIEAFGPK
jgi:hypothetical protein